MTYVLGLTTGKGTCTFPTVAVICTARAGKLAAGFFVRTMTAIHEISQTIWLDTPKGLALAKFLIDRGIDSDLEWVTVLNETGQVLCFDNSDVQVCKSFTLGRRVDWADFNYPTKKRRAIARKHGAPNSMRKLLRKF